MVVYYHSAPTCLTLITTFRCNAACDNCCFGCRPGHGRTMTFEEMKYYIDTCLKAYPNSIKELCLTGGECFLLGEALDHIIDYAHQKGLKVWIVSNGFWGRSYQEASKRIATLKHLGLTGLTFSVGEDHQHILPIGSCRNAVVAAARAGYKVEVRLESNLSGRSAVRDKLEMDVPFMRLVNMGQIMMQSWRWSRFNNEIKHAQLHPWHTSPYGEFKPCDLLSGNIVVTPYGDVMACTGIACSRIPALRLGNIWKQSVSDMYDSIYADMLKVWIHKKGPQAVLQYVYENSKIRFHKVGPCCDSCMEIFSNPKIIPFLEETYDDWTSKQNF